MMAEDDFDLDAAIAELEATFPVQMPDRKTIRAMMAGGGVTPTVKVVCPVCDRTCGWVFDHAPKVRMYAADMALPERLRPTKDSMIGPRLAFATPIIVVMSDDAPERLRRENVLQTKGAPASALASCARDEVWLTVDLDELETWTKKVYRATVVQRW